MGRTQFEQDSRDIGLAVADGQIILLAKTSGPSRGPLAGAKVTVDQSIGEPSTWAKLNTPLSRRGTVQGRARVWVTVTCADGVTLIVECPPKHEGAARRWAAVVNAAAVTTSSA